MRPFLIATFVLFYISPVFASVFSEGHGGLGLGEGGQLELHLHLHEGAVVDGVALTEEAEYEPGKTIILIPNTTRLARPDGTEWDFIGNAAGNDTWVLPQTYSTGIPFFGISAEEVTFGAFVDNAITLTLVSVDGPGHFSLYDLAFGVPAVFMADSDGSTADDAVIVDLDVSGHCHYNFAFSQAGMYAITFEVSAIDTTLQTPVTDEATFIFHVVPEPATLSLLALGIRLLRKK
jgi:surface-anchored protein